MQFSFFAVAATLLAAVSAQDGLPDCAKSCVTGFTSGSTIGGCPSLAIACICSSQAFLKGIACCLNTGCNAADQALAITYAQTLCLTAGVTVPNSIQSLCPANSTSSTTGTAAATAASSTASSSTTATTTASSSATTASKAAAHRILAGGAGVVGGLAAMFAFL